MLLNLSVLHEGEEEEEVMLWRTLLCIHLQLEQLRQIREEILAQRQIVADDKETCYLGAEMWQAAQLSVLATVEHGAASA